MNAKRIVGRVGRIVITAMLTAWAAAGCVAGLCAGGGPAGREQDKSPALATVGGTAITAKAFGEEVRRLLQGAPPQMATPESVMEYLKSKAETEALAQAAREAGYERDPEIQSTLRQIMARKYEMDQMGKQGAEVSITEADLEAFFAAHVNDYVIPRMRKAAMILVSPGPAATPEKKLEARRKIEQAAAEAAALPATVANFGEVAARFSEDAASRQRGGDSGWMGEGDPPFFVEPAILKALFALAKPGEISPVVETAAGFALLRYSEEKPAAVPTLADVRDKILDRLTLERRDEARRRFIGEVTRTRPIVIDQDVADRVIREIIASLPAAPPVPAGFPMPFNRPPAPPARPPAP